MGRRILIVAADQRPQFKTLFMTCVFIWHAFIFFLHNFIWHVFIIYSINFPYFFLINDKKEILVIKWEQRLKEKKRKNIVVV